MVFGKKKKIVEQQQNQEDSSVVSANVTPVIKGKVQDKDLKPELTETQKVLVELAKNMKEEYGDYLTPIDAANVSLPVIQSESIVLLVAIYGELKKVVELLEDMREE